LPVSDVRYDFDDDEEEENTERIFQALRFWQRWCKEFNFLGYKPVKVNVPS
jgi:hypothetical protein